MKSLLAIGTVVLLVGVVMVLFGGVNTVSYSGTTGNTAQPTWTATTTCYLYPMMSLLPETPPLLPPQIWNPNALGCVISASPSAPVSATQLSFSFSSSTNYTLNGVGMALVLLGVVVVVRGYGQHPKVDSTNHGPKT